MGRGINMPGVTRQAPANQQLQQTFSGTRKGPLADWELEGQKIIRQAGDQDERTLRLRSQGTPLVPAGKRRFNFFGSGGPGGSPEQQAAIEEARFRVSYPDDPDPIRTPGFYSPETPPSERTPLSFAAPQIPEDPGMGGVSALSRPGLPAPGPYTSPFQEGMPSSPYTPPFPGRGFEEMPPGGVPAISSGTAPVGRGINMPGATLQAPAHIGRNVQGGGGEDEERGGWRGFLRDNQGQLIESGFNAAGQLMSGGGMDDYYRRQAAVNERMMALREQQAAYDQDRERLKEALQLRGSRSKWA